MVRWLDTMTIEAGEELSAGDIVVVGQDGKMYRDYPPSDWLPFYPANRFSEYDVVGIKDSSQVTFIKYINYMEFKEYMIWWKSVDLNKWGKRNEYSKVYFNGKYVGLGTFNFETEEFITEVSK